MNRREMLERSAAVSLGAAALVQPNPAFGQDLTTLLAASAPEDSVSAILWAQKSGIFRRNGLDVQLEAQRSGSTVAAAVAGGTYQLGKASITSLIAAHLRGVPFVVIAPASIYEASKPNTGLLVKVDSPIRTAADLNGKTVAVASLNDLYAIGTRLWVDKNGGDSSTLKLIEMPLNVIPGALATGRIDAGASDTPALQDAIDSGKVRLLSHMQDAFGVNFLVTAWFTTSDFIAKNRVAVRSFVKAFRESAVYVNAHHADTVDLIAKFTAVEPSVIEKMARVTIGTVLDPKLIQPVINASAKYKAIANGFDARDLLTAEFT